MSYDLARDFGISIDLFTTRVALRILRSTISDEKVSI